MNIFSNYNFKHPTNFQPIPAEDKIRNLDQELEQRVQDCTTELKKKNAELERMNWLFTGRELRMAKLKKEIVEF